MQKLHRAGDYNSTSMTLYAGICCISTLNALACCYYNVLGQLLNTSRQWTHCCFPVDLMKKANSKEYMNNQDIKVGAYLIEY